MLRRISLVFLLLSLFLVGSCKASDEDPVLGKSGDFVIKKSDLMRFIGYHSDEARGELMQDPEQLEGLVKRILEVRAVSEKARKDKFDQKPEVKERLQYTMDDYLAQEYVKESVMGNLSVSDSELKTFYDSNASSFAEPEQVRVRQILVLYGGEENQEQGKKQAREKAERALKKIKEGASFEQVASEFSDDTDSKQTGGDIGYLSRGQMEPALEEVVFNLKPGEVSGVIESDFAYYVVKVEERKPAGTKPFDEVKEAIRGRMISDLAVSRIEEFVKKIATDAHIEVYGDKIKNLSTEP